MGNDFDTINDYSGYEVMSALQKEIRRSNTENAMYWAYEMAESGYWNPLIKRMRVILYEDIGVKAGQDYLIAKNCIEDLKDYFKDKNEKELLLANCIQALCRCDKSRDGENLRATVDYERRTEPKKEVPDYAFDRHTYEGKKRGRGWEHFFNEAAKLEPDVSNEEWAEKAEKAWKEHGKKDGEIDFNNKSTKDRKKNQQSDLNGFNQE